MSLTVLAYLVISRVYPDQFGVERTFGINRIAIILVAVGLIVLRRLVTRLYPRAVPSLDQRLTSFHILFIVLALSGLALMLVPTLANTARGALFDILYRTRAAVAVNRLDDRYGHVLVPNASDVARNPAFTATYTIDADGHRVTPTPASPRATVVFLGDSYTFGWGVADHETYPYVLASEYWPDVRVINGAVSGWGLTQFHIALTDILARTPLPDAVIVSLIADDLRRSHLRPPEVPGVRRRLELIDGTLVPRDLSAEPARIPDTPELLEKETRLATATFQAMIEASRGKGLPLGIVLLGDNTPAYRTPPFPPDLIYALGARGVPILDLTRLEYSRLRWDQHPDAATYRRIAAAIAVSPLSALVRRPSSNEHDQPVTPNRAKDTVP